jgi:hypothetical protein
MSEHMCQAPTPLQDLLAYWLGEMNQVSQTGFEEHLFGCAECSARLARLVELASAIKHEIRAGRLSAMLPASFIQRLKDDGMRVREYRMQPGGSINCTITPEDDLVVTHLHAPLGNVGRLDVIVDEVEAGSRYRLEDVAFDPGSDDVVLFPASADVRKLGVATLRVELVAVSGDEERVLGRYTLNHSPTR